MPGGEKRIPILSGKVHLHDLHATILHLLGLDHERLTWRHLGRDFRLTDVYGEVVREILVSDEFISSTAGRISHSLCRHVAGRCE